jgi:DNA polymerase III epsilon subunit-like protein
MEPGPAVFVDVETTGLDPATDEIIEMAIVPFDFSSDGRIFSVHESFSRFRDPGRPIPAAVVAITGITDEMVAGKSIDAAEIEAFLGAAVVVIAHNAAFDRRFAERLCGAFAHLAWACSWSEVPWAEEGFTEGAKLGHLAAACGFFHDGHRAVHDCHAGLEILSRVLPRSRAPQPRCSARVRPGAAAMAHPRRRGAIRTPRILEVLRLPLGSEGARPGACVVCRRPRLGARCRARPPPAGDLPTTSTSTRGASMRSTGTPIVADRGRWRRRRRGQPASAPPNGPRAAGPRTAAGRQRPPARTARGLEISEKSNFKDSSFQGFAFSRKLEFKDSVLKDSF